MPYYNGNTKIDRRVITDGNGVPTEIDLIRIGATSVFPDSVGSPIINGFSISSTAVVPNTETLRTLTVSGTEGATFRIVVSIGSLDRSDFTIGSSETENYVWTIPGQETGDPVEMPTATIEAVGLSILEEGLVTSITLSQAAGTPFLARNLQRGTPDYTYTWSGSGNGTLSVSITPVNSSYVESGRTVALVALAGVNYSFTDESIWILQSDGSLVTPPFTVANGTRFPTLNNVSSSTHTVRFRFSVPQDATHLGQDNDLNK